jgi:hypothetical protein
MLTVGIAVVAFLFAGGGLLLLAMLDVASKERRPATVGLGVLAFLLGAGIGTFVTSGLELYERILLPPLFALGSVGAVVGTTALSLWLTDHTVVGQANRLLLESSPQMRTVSQSSPLRWLTPMLLPRRGPHDPVGGSKT